MLGKKVLLIDYSYNGSKNFNFINRKLGNKKNILPQELKIGDKIYYKLGDFNKTSTEENLKISKLDAIDIIINIIDLIEKEPISIQKTIVLIFFFLILKNGYANINDLKRVELSIGKEINRCKSGIFIH